MAAEGRLVVLAVACALLLAPAAAVGDAAPAPPEVTTATELAAPASPREVRRATDEVLSRRAYATEEPSWWARTAEAARRWLAERVLRLVMATSRTTVAWIVLALATAVALVVAWRLTRGTRWERRLDPSTVDLERRTAEDWDARSREAEARGDLREAIRTAYRAVLAAYAERGIIEEVPGRTVGEYRREVGSADPSRRRAFDEASDVVEAVLYADREPVREDLTTIRAAGPTLARTPA